MTKNTGMLPSMILYNCSLCDFTCKNSDSYRQHKNRCEKLDRVTASKDPDVNNTNTDNQELSYDRATIGGSFNKQRYNAVRPSNDLKFKCHLCDFATNSSSVFFYHQARTHKGKNNANMYFCKACKYSSPSKYQLISHMKKVHKMCFKTSDLKRGKVGVKKPKKSSVNISNVSAAKVAALSPVVREYKKHISSVKVATPPGPLQQFGGETYAYMTSTVMLEKLSNYRLVEVTGYLKPFMCSNCGMKSNYKHNIIRHTRRVRQCKHAQTINLRKTTESEQEEDFENVVNIEENDYENIEENVEIGENDKDLEPSAEVTGNEKLKNASNLDQNKDINDNLLHVEANKRKITSEVKDQRDSKHKKTLLNVEKINQSKKIKIKPSLDDNRHLAMLKSKSKWKNQFASKQVQKKVKFENQMKAQSEKTKLSVKKHDLGCKIRIRTGGYINGVYKPYKCSACNYRTNWRYDVAKHIRRMHKDVEAALIILSDRVPPIAKPNGGKEPLLAKSNSNRKLKVIRPNGERGPPSTKTNRDNIKCARGKATKVKPKHMTKAVYCENEISTCCRQPASQPTSLGQPTSYGQPTCHGQHTCHGQPTSHAQPTCHGQPTCHDRQVTSTGPVYNSSEANFFMCDQCTYTCITRSELLVHLRNHIRCWQELTRPYDVYTGTSDSTSTDNEQYVQGNGDMMMERSSWNHYEIDDQTGDTYVVL